MASAPTVDECVILALNPQTKLRGAVAQYNSIALGLASDSDNATSYVEGMGKIANFWGPGMPTAWMGATLAGVPVKPPQDRTFGNLAGVLSVFQVEGDMNLEMIQILDMNLAELKKGRSVVNDLKPKLHESKYVKASREVLLIIKSNPELSIEAMSAVVFARVTGKKVETPPLTPHGLPPLPTPEPSKALVVPQAMPRKIPPKDPLPKVEVDVGKMTLGEFETLFGPPLTKPPITEGSDIESEKSEESGDDEGTRAPGFWVYDDPKEPKSEKPIDRDAEDPIPDLNTFPGLRPNPYVRPGQKIHQGARMPGALGKYQDTERMKAEMVSVWGDSMGHSGYVNPAGDTDFPSHAAGLGIKYGPREDWDAQMSSLWNETVGISDSMDPSYHLVRTPGSKAMFEGMHIAPKGRGNEFFKHDGIDYFCDIWGMFSEATPPDTTKSETAVANVWAVQKLADLGELTEEDKASLTGTPASTLHHIIENTDARARAVFMTGVLNNAPSPGDIQPVSAVGRDEDLSLFLPTGEYANRVTVGGVSYHAGKNFQFLIQYCLSQGWLSNLSPIVDIQKGVEMMFTFIAVFGIKMDLYRKGIGPQFRATSRMTNRQNNLGQMTATLELRDGKSVTINSRHLFSAILKQSLGGHNNLLSSLFTQALPMAWLEREPKEEIVFYKPVLDEDNEGWVKEGGQWHLVFKDNKGWYFSGRPISQLRVKREVREEMSGSLMTCPLIDDVTIEAFNTHSRRRVGEINKTSGRSFDPENGIKQTKLMRDFWAERFRENKISFVRGGPKDVGPWFDFIKGVVKFLNRKNIAIHIAKGLETTVSPKDEAVSACYVILQRTGAPLTVDGINSNWGALRTDSIKGGLPSASDLIAYMISKGTLPREAAPVGQPMGQATLGTLQTVVAGAPPRAPPAPFVQQGYGASVRALTKVA